MMSSLIGGIILFFGNALALKIAAGAMGASSTKNTYRRALTVAFWLMIAHLVIGFVPLVSLPLYAIVWVGAVMAVYELSFWRSLGVAVVHFGVKMGLVFLLKLIGLSPSWVDLPV